MYIIPEKMCTIMKSATLYLNGDRQIGYIEKAKIIAVRNIIT